MQASPRPTISLLALTTLLTLTSADPAPAPAPVPAPLIIDEGSTVTSTKTVTATSGVVPPDTTIKVDSIGIDGSLHTTYSGSAATSYLEQQSSSLSSSECARLQLHGIPCTSVSTVTTTLGSAEAAAAAATQSANKGARSPRMLQFSGPHTHGNGEMGFGLGVQAIAALFLASVCGVFAFVL